MNEGIEKNLQKNKYSTSNSLFKEQRLSAAFNDIDERLTELEKKVFKTLKRVKATKAQRTLIFYHLGLLDHVVSLPTSKNNQALILSVIIDSDPDVEKDINSIIKKSPTIISEYNYKFLVAFFESVGLEKQASICERVLIKILERQGK